MHPKHEIAKVYIARIKGILSKDKLSVLKTGVEDQGELLKVNDFRIISTDKKRNTMIIELKLHEGKNRHIRRMMDRLGHPVLKLRREQYGVITIGKMQPGQYRPLTRQEIHQLKQIALENVKH